MKMFKMKYKKLNTERYNRSIRDPPEQKPLKTLHPRTVTGVVGSPIYLIPEPRTQRSLVG